EDGAMRVGLIRLPGLMRDGGYEAVAAFGNGLDELRTGGVVPEELAQLQNIGAQDLGLDVGFRPESLEEFVVGDEALGIFNEVAQQGEGAGSEAEALAAAPETLIDGVELEVSKGLHCLVGRTPGECSKEVAIRRLGGICRMC